uniref:Uncharacterized protein n=1 Tax=Pristionchus pacificus TaxID=54126 RepID=A0A2A6CVX0_PRIPA|eukprot:PDM82335.1 hypothetical protein PRIPAC_36728 [Pristionchus pacificus]
MTELRVKGKCWIGSATTSTITRKNRSVKSGGEKQNVMRPGSTANASADFKSNQRDERERKMKRGLMEIPLETKKLGNFKAENQYDCCKYAVKRVAVRTKE